MNLSDPKPEKPRHILKKKSGLDTFLEKVAAIVGLVELSGEFTPESIKKVTTAKQRERGVLFITIMVIYLLITGIIRNVQWIVSLF